jgi:DNA invertase Pin-like site-specific DNA recombinase
MSTQPEQRRPEVAAGMAVARKRGVRLGRPTAALPASAQRADELRQQGLSLAAIAETLDRENVPTLS